jgi:hypothetical protein
MSYESVQSALVTQLENVTGFSSTNVSLGDYHVLGKGVSKAIVLRPGAFDLAYDSYGGAYAHRWDVLVELFEKYQDDSQVQNAIRDDRQAIIDRLAQYPTLDGTAGVLDARIVRGEEPEPVYGADGSGPHFWMQRMVCQILEDASYTLG